MKWPRNVYLWFATTLFVNAAFLLPIWIIFFTDVLGMNNTQAFILGVLPYGLCALFEVPTGTWADKYGRARIYQLGTLLYILSVASLIFLDNFYVLLPLQIIGAVGLAMQSGGLEALVHDSLPDQDKDTQYARAHAYKMAITFGSRVVTVLLGAWLFTVDPRAPLVAAVAAYAVGWGISLLFKDVRTETPSELSSWAHMRETTRMLVSKPVLITLLGLSLLYTLLSETLFVFYQPYFKAVGVDIGHFGVFFALISLLSAIGALSVAATMRRLHTTHILLGMTLAGVFTLGLMLLEIPALLYLAIIPSSLAFGYVITIKNTVIQKLIPSRHQATALSIASLLRNGALLVSSTVVGVLLDLISVRAANIVLVVSGLVFLVPFILAALRQRQLAGGLAPNVPEKLI